MSNWCTQLKLISYIDGFVQHCGNTCALDMEWLQPCTMPSIAVYIYVTKCGLATPCIRLSQMRAPLAACRKQAGCYNRVLEVLFILENKTQYQSMPHVPRCGFFDISVIYPHIFRRVKFVVIPPCFVWQQYCEIVLHNSQLVVITYEIIHVVQAARC